MYKIEEATEKFENQQRYINFSSPDPSTIPKKTPKVLVRLSLKMIRTFSEERILEKVNRK